MTCTPVSERWFLDQCLTLPNHIIISSGTKVIWAGTISGHESNDTQFDHAVASMQKHPDAGMTIRHTYKDLQRGNTLVTRLALAPRTNSEA